MADKERLIDAIALISKARRMETTDNNGIPVDTFSVPVLAIEDAPTVDAAPVVHAHWEEWWPGDCALIMTGEEMLYRCTHCDAKFSDIENKRYCSWCGAMMDEEKEDTCE